MREMTDSRTVTDREVLDRTSRSFSLSIRLLPRGLRSPVEIAYLLARAADTVADTELAPRERRLALLDDLRAVLEDPGRPLAHMAELGEGKRAADDDPVAEAEAALLCGVERLAARFAALPAPERADVRAVVDILAATMQSELRHFDGALTAWPDEAALVRYTEGIAGCVGSFWTRLVAREVSLSPKLERALEIEGRRYGRGLQLVNILRDLPRDLRRGVCFLPEGELARLGLAPEELLDPKAETRLAPLLRRLGARARRGLLAGVAYTARLPARAYSLRVSTLLPAAIGLATLERLAATRGRLDPEHVVKIERRELRALVVHTLLACATPRGPRCFGLG